MVAVTSNAHPKDRVEGLLEFAAVCRGNDERAASAALRHAVHAIAGRAETGGESDRRLGRLALEVAEEAESMKLAELATEAYEAGLAALGGQPGGSICSRLWLGLSQHRESEGDGHGALECLQKMVESLQVDGEEIELLEGLSRLVETEKRWGSEEGCQGALREGLRVVEGVVASGAGSSPGLWRAAHMLGRCAEAVGAWSLARAVYLQTLEVVGDRASSALSGVIWHDIGDTWMSQDEGEKALEAYRLAAARRRGGESIDVAALLVDLAGAESAWGSRRACLTAAEEGARLITALTPESDDEADLVGELTEVLSELTGPDRGF